MNYIGSFDPISETDHRRLRRLAKKGKICITCFEDGILPKKERLLLLNKVFQKNHNINIMEVISEADIWKSQDEKAIQEGKFYYAPKVIRYYLVKTHAFAKNILQLHLKAKRVAHSYSVANVCANLAKLYHLDTERAYLMGLWHDICKDEEEQVRKFKQLKTYQLIPKWAIHGFLAADWLKKNLGIQDKILLHAIERHSLGLKGQNAYDYILFIADKIEPLRAYDTRAEEQLARTDLKKCVKLVLKNQKIFLEGQKNGQIK